MPERKKIMLVLVLISKWWAITTLLSIGGGNASPQHFLQWWTILLSGNLSVTPQQKRPGFVGNGFQGLHLSLGFCKQKLRHIIYGASLWRIKSQKTSQAQLILTGAVQIILASDPWSFPLDSIQKDVNWIHGMAFGYHVPQRVDSTGDHAADELVLVILSKDICLDSGESWGYGIDASTKVLAITDAWDMIYKASRVTLQRH